MAQRSLEQQALTLLAVRSIEMTGGKCVAACAGGYPIPEAMIGKIENVIPDAILQGQFGTAVVDVVDPSRLANEAGIRNRWQLIGAYAAQFRMIWHLIVPYETHPEMKPKVLALLRQWDLGPTIWWV